MTARRATKLLKDLGAAALAVVAFLVAAEAAFHAAGLRFGGSFYSADRELGYVLRPNAHGWSVSENANYFEVNSEGMADREHSSQRPPGVIRIAIVGDSVSEAKHVPRDRAFWAVMERIVNSKLARSGQKIEVLNFGVAGYGLAQDSIMIEKRVFRFDPQIVVLAGTIESSTLRSTRSLSPSLPSEHVPFYILQDGVPVPDAATQEERLSFSDSRQVHRRLGDLMNASRIAALIHEGSTKVSGKMSDELHSDLPVSDYDENRCFLGPASPRLRAAWETSEALILRSREQARRHGAEFWFFTLDMPQQVEPDSRIRSEFERHLGVNDLFRSDRLLADFCTRNGILHGTLGPEMQAFAEQRNICLHGFAGTPRNTGHWNESGHREAGELIARTLLNESPTLKAPTLVKHTDLTSGRRGGLAPAFRRGG